MYVFAAALGQLQYTVQVPTLGRQAGKKQVNENIKKREYLNYRLEQQKCTYVQVRNIFGTDTQ